MRSTLNLSIYSNNHKNKITNTNNNNHKIIIHINISFVAVPAHTFYQIQV